MRPSHYPDYEWRSLRSGTGSVRHVFSIFDLQWSAGCGVYGRETFLAVADDRKCRKCMTFVRSQDLPARDEIREPV